jgi:hypothetical protein
MATRRLNAKALIEIQDVHLKPLLGGEEDARRAVRLKPRAAGVTHTE